MEPINNTTETDMGNVAGISNGISKQISRNQKIFASLFGIAVIVLSFLYGLFSGLQNKVAVARYQSGIVDAEIATLDPGLVRDDFILPDDAKIKPIGSSVTLNGMPGEVISFFSNKQVSDIVAPQISLWRKSGFEIKHHVSPLQGVIFASDNNTKKKYSMIVSSVPSLVRNLVADGFAFKGVISVVDSDNWSNERVLEVPDVPLIAGGSSSPIFSSEEKEGKRSYSTLYRNPGSIVDNVEFYRSELTALGWQEKKQLISVPNMTTLQFERDEEEVVLLMSSKQPFGKSSDQSEVTHLTVIRAPRFGISN